MKIFPLAIVFISVVPPRYALEGVIVLAVALIIVELLCIAEKDRPALSSIPLFALPQNHEPVNSGQLEDEEAA